MQLARSQQGASLPRRAGLRAGLGGDPQGLDADGSPPKLRNVAVLAYHGLAPFEFGVCCEAFGLDRTEDAVPLLDFAVCAPTRQVRTNLGFTMGFEHGLERAAEADLICIPSVSADEGVPASVVELLKDAHAKGTRLLALCSGVFALGAAGLLDGISVTTHWIYTERLAAEYPLARVVPEVLYVDEDPIITAAGTAAGLDAALHLWRKDYGAAVAAAVARRMVVPPQRSGGQAQYIRASAPEAVGETLAPLISWMSEHLDEDLTVARLAHQATMSERTFARRFRDEIGTTPHAWLTRQRVMAAEQLLETTEWGLNAIADEVGFGTSAALRHHFLKVRGVSPTDYRRAFSHR